MTKSPADAEANRQMPRHVAIIMDGNGRWARARGKSREEGHRQGVENVKRIVECAREMDLRYLTLYAFSVENWNRPRMEVNALMRLLESFLKSQTADLIEKGIRLRIAGKIDKLPTRVRKRLEAAVEQTREFHKWNLTLALNYGARTETIDAIRQYAHAVLQGQENPDDLDWNGFSRFLYTADLPDPDLVIRTSGEYRISNFLLLQSAYAEYFFTDAYWPDFSPELFREALLAYQKRERRYGMTSEQIQNK